MAIKKLLEAEMGVEPIHVGFADQCLPTWLLRRCRQYGNKLCDAEHRGRRVSRYLENCQSEMSEKVFRQRDRQYPENSGSDKGTDNIQRKRQRDRPNGFSRSYRLGYLTNLSPDEMRQQRLLWSRQALFCWDSAVHSL